MIILKNVSKVFPNGNIAVKDFNLEVKDGEFVFLTGPSGAGKTTLMRLITKYFEPSSGQILFQGKDLSQVKGKQLFEHRRKIGVVFQDYKLLPELNTFENIALSLEIANKKNSQIEKRVLDLLKLVDLTDKAELFPSQLSGGEAQRISLARALANAPLMIFADEATGNLDSENSKHILRLLKKINELGTTIIMASHDTRLFDQVENSRVVQIKANNVNASEEEKTKVVPQTQDKVTAKDPNLTAPKSENETKAIKSETNPKNSQEKVVKTTSPEKKKGKKSFSLALPKFTLPFGKTQKKVAKPVNKELENKHESI